MKELRVPAVPENWDTVRAFAEAALEEAECPQRASIMLLVALEELFVNIAHYAYPDAVGDALIQSDMRDGMAVFVLSDSGIPFDPLGRSDPDTTLTVSERPVGGLGIFMVKKSMDLFTYERTDGKNKVTIGKKIS